MKITKFIIIVLLFIISGCKENIAASEVTIFFLSNGGNNLNDLNVFKDDEITLPTPIREGYNFIEWKDTEGISYPMVSKFTDDITLVAQWQIKKFTVKFVDYDNTILKQEVIDYNKTAPKPENPSRSGYSFVGWDQDFINVKSDLIVNAIYEESTIGLEFNLIGEEYAVVDYIGEAKNVIIPSHYNGKKVTTIGKEAFKMSNIISVVFPDSILYIEEYAFLECSYLEEVNIPTSVIEIKKSAFENNVALHKVTIGAKVIGNSAFYNSSSLVDINILNNTETIGEGAFYNCANLINLTIPDSVTSIGDNFVSWCQKLETISTSADNVDNLQQIINNVNLIYVKSLNMTVMPTK